jgi:phosphoglucomutase
LFKDYASLKQTDATGNISDLDMDGITSDVLQLFTEDGTKISIRPSGTEPKIKFYIELRGNMNTTADYEKATAEAEAKIAAVRSSLGI